MNRKHFFQGYAKWQRSTSSGKLKEEIEQNSEKCNMLILKNVFHFHGFLLSLLHSLYRCIT